jgi:hypothetical protein
MNIDLLLAIKKAFDYLDNNYTTKWSTKAATRDKLISAFAQTEVSPAKYLGYKTNDGVRHAMQRAILYPKCNKPKSQEYRDWLLQLVDLFWCKHCTSIKPLAYKLKNENQCKECDSDNTKLKRNNKRALVYNYLLDKHCADCGITDPVVLEFDHRDPSLKIDNISNMMSKSWDTILAEINKCDIVCANCHRKRTAKQYGWYSFLLK